MTKQLIYFISLACVFLIGLFFFLSTINKEIADSKAPLVLAMTKSIDVPLEVEFAGEKLTLNRYDLYERYDREINNFTYQQSTTLLLIKKANRYFPLIEPILKSQGIPDDFKYLAVIESNLNHRIGSSAGAIGLWQFMPKTAPSYGLEVTAEVDERFSIEKSTLAACKYFKQAYAKYGNWAAVALSYNAGQGRISDELNKQQVEDSLDLWLVEETSRYYFRILAAKEIFKSPPKYGFVLTEDQLYKPLEYKTVEATQSIPDLAVFAKSHGITYAQLKDFNSWLRDRKLTISAKSKQAYTILIPAQKFLYYNKGEKVKVHDKDWLAKD